MPSLAAAVTEIYRYPVKGMCAEAMGMTGRSRPQWKHAVTVPEHRVTPSEFTLDRAPRTG